MIYYLLYVRTRCIVQLPFNFLITVSKKKYAKRIRFNDEMPKRDWKDLFCSAPTKRA